MNLNTNTTSHLQIPFYAPFILTGFQHFSPSFLASVWLLGVQSVIAVSLSSWADRSDAPSSQPASFFIFSFSYSFFFYPPYQVKCQTFSLFFSIRATVWISEDTTFTWSVLQRRHFPKVCFFQLHPLTLFFQFLHLWNSCAFFFKLPGFSLKHHHFFHNTPPGKFPYIVNVLNGGGSNI